MSYFDDNKADKEEIENCEINRQLLELLKKTIENRQSLTAEKRENCNSLCKMIEEIIKDASDDIDGKLWFFTFSSRCSEGKLNPDHVEDILSSAMDEDWESFDNKITSVLQKLAEEEQERIEGNKKQICQAQKAHDQHETFDWKELSKNSSQMFMAEAFIPENEQEL